MSIGTLQPHGPRRRREREGHAHGVLSVMLGALLLGACAEQQRATQDERAHQVEPAAQEAAGPVPTPSIGRVTAQGTGCAPDSADVLFGGDNQSFTVRFSEYAAEVSPDEPAYRVLKECAISIDINSPPGYRYAVTAFRMHGYAALDPGVLGATQVGYSFVGAARPRAVFQRSHDLAGPFDDAFDFYDSVPASQLSWSDCTTQRTLLLNTRIMLTNDARPPAFGSMTMTRVDADTSFIDVDVDWARCPDPAP